MIWPFKKTQPVEQKSLADPAGWLEEIFGSTPTQSGVSVTAETALRVPAVNSAIRVISEAVATLDVEIRRIGADGTEAPDRSHPALSLLVNEANDFTPAPDFIRDLVIDALAHDAGGLAWVPDPFGHGERAVQFLRALRHPKSILPNRTLRQHPCPSLEWRVHCERGSHKKASRPSGTDQRRWLARACARWLGRTSAGHASRSGAGKRHGR